MGLPLFIAHRISLSPDGKSTSPAVRVAIAAVALSVIVMIAAIAIVLGFKEEITSKVTGFNSQMTLYNHISPDSENQSTPDSPADASNILTLTPSLRSILDSIPFLEDYALQASIPAIMKTSDDFKGIYLKSLSGRDMENFISNAIIDGKMPDFSSDKSSDKIVISRAIADRLNLKTGSGIDTYFITDQVRARRLEVSAIYNSHFEAFDDAFAFGALPLIQHLGGLSENQGTSLAISTSDFDKINDFTSEVNDRLIHAYTSGFIYRLYRSENALESGAAYFQWLSMLDMNVIVVLVLMTIVAAVTLISGMLILMVEKIRLIALLSALGASRKQIGRIFILLASKIALIGLIIGNVVALSILYTQKVTHYIPLDPESYYIDFVPVKISIPAVLILNAGVMAIIWIILILPARFAGKAAPTRTLTTE